MDEKQPLMDRNKFVLVASSFLTAIFNTVALLAIARNLEVTTLGALGFALSLVGVISFVGDMGYTHAFLRALDKGHGFARCYGHYRMAKMKLTFVIVGIGALLIIIWHLALMNMDPTLGIYQGAHPVHPASLSLVVGYVAVTNMSQIWLTGYLARGGRSIQRSHDIMESSIRLFMILAVINLGFTIGGQVDVFVLAFAYIAASAFGLVFLIFRGKKLRARKAGDEVMLDMDEVAGKMLPFAAFACVLLHIDKIIIWYFHGLDDVGYYFAAQRIVIFVAASSGAIALILGGALVRLKDDCQRLGDCLGMTERYITLMAIPVTIFYVMFAGDILGQFLGGNFARGADSAALLAVSGFFVALAAPLVSYMLEIDDFKSLARNTGTALAVNAIVAIALVPDSFILPGVRWLHGINGAGFAALAASLVAYVGYRRSVTARVPFRSNPRVLLHILSGATMAFAARFLIWYFEIEILWYWIFIFAALCAFLYGVMLYLTGEFLRRDFNTFKELVGAGTETDAAPGMGEVSDVNTSEKRP